MASAKKKKRPAVAATKPADNQQQHPVAPSNSYVLPAFLLVLASALLYGHSLWNPLVFDDLPFFVDYDLWQYGASFFHLDLRWFSYASFGWTYNLFGHDWFWYRLGNLALHALTSILLFVFFSRLLDATAQPQAAVTQPRWPAFFAALIFALHPAAVYGVAYLVERSIVMATLFGIAALLCYMEGLVRENSRWFVLSALFYFLAVFSKEHSIMIPGVAAALTLLLHKPSFALIKKVWLPFSLYLMIGTLIILRTKGLLGTTYEYLAAGMLAQLSDQQQDINIEHAYGLSVITEGFMFFKYLLLWVVPYTGWMTVDLRQPFATHFLSWPQLPSFILFLAYPVLAMKLLLKGGRKGLLGFGLLFPWILYLTELTSVRIQEPFVLYRSYLWMSGLPVVLLAIPAAASKRSITILLPMLCLTAAALAWNRLDTFSSALKLWSDAIAKNHDEKLLGVERAYNNRGNAYADLGRLSEALADYEKVIEINPKYTEGYNNSGNMYARLNKFEEALPRYSTAIELKPDYFVAYGNRALVLSKLGRYAESLSDFDRAIQLDPENPSYYSNRAIAYSKLGRLQEAQSDYITALAIYDQILRFDPNNSKALLHRGFALNALNRKSEAMENFRKSCDAGNSGGCKQLHLE